MTFFGSLSSFGWAFFCFPNTKSAEGITEKDAATLKKALIYRTKYCGELLKRFY